MMRRAVGVRWVGSQGCDVLMEMVLSHTRLCLHARVGREAHQSRWSEGRSEANDDEVWEMEYYGQAGKADAILWTGDKMSLDKFLALVDC